MEKHPGKLPSKTYQFNLGCGHTYIVISYLNNKPFDVIVHKGHSNACGRCVAEAVGKLCSSMLRSGISHEDIIPHLSDISCGEGYWEESGIYIGSCFDAIAKSLGGLITQ